MKTVRSHGADAVLIGETLMRSSHIAETMAALREASMKQQCKIKFCGIRRLEDVTYMNEFMPDYVGFCICTKQTSSVSCRRYGTGAGTAFGYQTCRRICKRTYR